MHELIDSEIPERVRRRLKMDVLADFICKIHYKEDKGAWYIVAEPWPQYDDGLIQVRMPKEGK